MKKLITIILLSLLINNHFTKNVNAAGSFFRVVANFFKGGIDDSIRAGGSKTDDLIKKIEQNPEEILTPKDQSLILERVGIEKHSKNYHGVTSNKTESIQNRKWLKEIIQDGSGEAFEEVAEEAYGEAAEKGLNNLANENDFYKYVKLNWIGRVYLRSDYYNQPKVEKKMMLVCKTKYEVFYFAILMEEKIKTASLIDHESFFNASYPTLSAQELLVLEDKNEFKVMSVIPINQNYPKHYFTIFNDQSFSYDKRLSGSESPYFIINKAKSSVRDKNNTCHKGGEKGLLSANR